MNPLATIIIANLLALTVVIILFKTVFAKPKYVVNYYSKEIHRKDSKDTRCRINNMTNCADIDVYQMRRLLKKGYNGCRYCLPEHDTDYINNKKGLKK
jgi:hypothetical protein